MSDFFNGWRRKAGCVLLVMATVFTGIWARSRYVVDILIITAQHRGYSLVSRPRGLTLSLYLPPSPEWLPSSRIEWKTEVVVSDAPAYSMAFRDEFADRDVYWRWEWRGFDFGQIRGSKGEMEQLFVFIIPFWSTTIPLTILSTFLILRPGKRKAAKPTQISTSPTLDCHSEAIMERLE